MATAARSEKGYKTKYLFLETTIAAALLCVHERNTPAPERTGSMRILKTPPARGLYLQKISAKRNIAVHLSDRETKREEIKPFGWWKK